MESSCEGLITHFSLQKEKTFKENRKKNRDKYNKGIVVKIKNTVVKQHVFVCFLNNLKISGETKVRLL